MVLLLCCWVLTWRSREVSLSGYWRVRWREYEEVGLLGVLGSEMERSVVSWTSDMFGS